MDLTPALTSEETLRSQWFDGTELHFLSIEKLENKSPASGAMAGSTQDLTGIEIISCDVFLWLTARRKSQGIVSSSRVPILFAAVTAVVKRSTFVW